MVLQQVSVEVCEPFDHVLYGELRLNDASTVLSHALRAWPIRQQPSYPTRQRVRNVNWNQKTAVSVPNHLGVAPNVGGHTRKPTGHCFQQRVGHSFAARWETENVTSLQ